MKITGQIFSKALPGMPRIFNPYLQIGRFAVAIDRDGICIEYGSRCCGYIRGAGFHRGFNH